jgi:hypothetical protein
MLGEEILPVVFYSTCRRLSWAFLSSTQGPQLLDLLRSPQPLKCGQQHDSEMDD